MTDTAPAVTVRRAVPADVPLILEVAHAAWRATYPDLLGADAVERFIAAAYTPERVALRIERHTVFVAGSGGLEPASVDAFVESVVEDDGRAHIVALYTRPGLRGQGLGTALLDAVVAEHPGRDITADVLVGNGLGEPFYAARGFEPGELLEEEIAGETIHERRWWLRARHVES
jgi:ribosomal protein S18 acetylase RimI-like enzyme